MTIAVGDRLPEAQFTVIGANGPEPVELSERLRGRRVIIFGLPGAFTPTCDSAHMPSFVRKAVELAAKGIDEIICISVNDPHVMRVWGEQTGAKAAGISLLADAACEFTEAIGMRFDAPPAGLIARSKRYALVAEDGIVTALQVEAARGTCELTSGEALLDLV
ncbi:peroxiredoxin [Tropicimonas marinistellae]|uniref:peroxiredoxin n=1 Tax=Tropicimonas marinistellae TaxID=1739787 RepID=UPI00082B6A1A|nr:peroxiredoxin [Tropicimonas marinistellae]